MANEEQLSILKQGVQVWNEWRDENPDILIDLSGADLKSALLHDVDLIAADLRGADLALANLDGAQLIGADMSGARLIGTGFTSANLLETNFAGAILAGTIFGNSDLSKVLGLERVRHIGPSDISTRAFTRSKGRIPEVFLRGCGLSDWEIEQVKLYNTDLSNHEFIDIQNRILALRNRQAPQISPLFISYSHIDRTFVDKIGERLAAKGIRYWRDIHDMKSGRLEKQIDRAIRQNPTVLVVLSEQSLSSDWVEHEVRMARELEKDMKRDVLCPIALDDSWKSSPWPKRVMEQIMEYNVLDFSEWEDDSKFEEIFRKLIDGLESFYKG